MPPQRTKGSTADSESTPTASTSQKPAKESSKPTTDDLNALGWAHPAELEYIKPEEWTCEHVIDFAVRHALFSVPRKPSTRNSEKFCTLTPPPDTDTEMADEVHIPIRYRAPLLWLVRFLWTSVKLVLTANDPDAEWKDYKFRILHLARLIAHFVEEASETSGEQMERKWRCLAFDRALVRYKKYWLIQEPEFVQRFFEAYGEDEYSRDILATDWRLWATRGAKPLKGFTLSGEEFDRGTVATDMISGLRWTGTQYAWNEKSKSPHFPEEPLDLPSQPTATFPKPRPIKLPQTAGGSGSGGTSTDGEHAHASAAKGSFSHFLQSSWDVPPPSAAAQGLPQSYNHLRPAALQQARGTTPPSTDDDTPMSPGSEQLLTALVTCFATLTDNIRGLSDEVRALREERALASYSAVYTPNRNGVHGASANGGGSASGSSVNGASGLSKTLYPPPANQPAPTLKTAVSWVSEDQQEGEDDSEDDDDDDMQVTPTSPRATAAVLGGGVPVDHMPT